MPPASLGCQLSASPYWTLPDMHRWRKVFLGSCVTADAHWVPAVWESLCRDSAWAPLCLFCRLPHARWHPYFTDERIEQHGERMQERWCHQRRGVWTAAGSHSELEESPVILNPRTFWGQGPRAPDSYEAWVVASPYSAWGWIWFWCLAQLDRRVLLPRLTLSCMIKPQPTSHLLTFS